ncbi:BC_2427 family protein [Bacillus cereus]|uniref:BC_2427 family protein n=1 Tax=Bacillus cereus TaxID=1396 RepID=UPI00356E4978
MNKPWISNKMIDKIFSEHKIILELEVEESPSEIGMEENLLSESEVEEESPSEIGMKENLFLESEVEEGSPSEIGMEENLFSESEVEEGSPSEIGMEENLFSEIEREDNSPPELKEGRLARRMTVRIPFSTIAEVTDFLISPIVSSTNEEVFAFQNEENETFRELDTKLLATVHHYNEQPYCRFISSKLFEKRIFLEFLSENYIKHSGKNQLEQSVWVPIHNLNLKQKNDKKSSNYVTTKLPVEIGKYKTEFSLEERVIFPEEVEIKEVSQEIVLTDSKFFTRKLLKAKEHSVTIEKGKLLVEGYIVQRIEYIVGGSNEKSNESVRYQLLQKMVLELVVQILQEQEVRVEIM